MLPRTSFNSILGIPASKLASKYGDYVSVLLSIPFLGFSCTGDAMKHFSFSLLPFNSILGILLSELRKPAKHEVGDVFQFHSWDSHS